MAELSTLARPYARAAFEFAQTAGSLDQWSSMLATAAAVSQQEKIAQVLSSPDLTSSDMARTFCELCGEVLDQNGRNFVSALAQNKRLSLLPQISEQFEALKSRLQQVVDVSIASAFELDPEQQQALADKLKQTLKQDVQMHTEVDKDLIGGVLIRAGDLVIDGSVRGKLAKLAEAMNQ